MDLMIALILLLHVTAIFSEPDAPDACPIRKDNLIGQLCQKICKQDKDCSGKRRCLCDGDCGLSCILIRSNCPWPVNIDNANTTLVKGTRNFGDQMLVLCHQGFKMATGQEKVLSRCQGDRKWSATAPCNDVQKPMVSCSAPPNIENGYVMEKATSFWVGESVQYKCNLGYQLEGHDVSACMENRSWSHPAPTCRQLFCPPPPEINDGYLIAVKKSEYEVSEEIYYLCKKNFYLDGSNSVTCEADGKWSESPACRARCKIPAQRSRVLYNGKKLWITEIPEALVHHSETVTFFCQHKDESCSYPASSQCFDGVLSLPECYEEPTWVQYNLFPKKVVSEIASCQEH